MEKNGAINCLNVLLLLYGATNRRVLCMWILSIIQDPRQHAVVFDSQSRSFFIKKWTVEEDEVGIVYPRRQIQRCPSQST